MHKSIHSLWSVEKWLHFEVFWEISVAVVSKVPNIFFGIPWNHKPDVETSSKKPIMYLHCAALHCIKHTKRKGEKRRQRLRWRLVVVQQQIRRWRRAVEATVRRRKESGRIRLKIYFLQHSTWKPPQLSVYSVWWRTPSKWQHNQFLWNKS